MTSVNSGGRFATASKQILAEDPEDRLEAHPLYRGEIDLDSTVVVCGAGGFISGHLVADLLRQSFSEV